MSSAHEVRRGIEDEGVVREPGAGPPGRPIRDPEGRGPGSREGQRVLDPGAVHRFAEENSQRRGDGHGRVSHGGRRGEDLGRYPIGGDREGPRVIVAPGAVSVSIEQVPFRVLGDLPLEMHGDGPARRELQAGVEPEGVVRGLRCDPAYAPVPDGVHGVAVSITERVLDGPCVHRLREPDPNRSVRRGRAAVRGRNPNDDRGRAIHRHAQASRGAALGPSTCNIRTVRGERDEGKSSEDDEGGKKSSPASGHRRPTHEEFYHASGLNDYLS